MSAPQAKSVLSEVLDRQTKELLRLREENEELKRQRDNETAASAAALRLVADIRFALGDDGKRMQDELVAWCKELRQDTVRLDDVLNTVNSGGTNALVARYGWGINDPISRKHIDLARKGPTFYEFIADKIMDQVVKTSAQ